MTRCKKCKVPIRYEPTLSGHQMPLDVEPVLDGNVVIREGVVRVLKKDELPEENELRYVSHFVTCTAPREFRKPRGKRVGGWDHSVAQQDANRAGRAR